MSERQEAIDAIVAHCHLPNTFFQLRGDELHLQPSIDEKYERVDCALAEVKRLQVTNMGFVGNEAYSDDLTGSAELNRPTFNEPGSAPNLSKKKN